MLSATISGNSATITGFSYGFVAPSGFNLNIPEYVPVLRQNSSGISYFRYYRVGAIASLAFADTAIGNIQIPSGVSHIGSNAFYNTTLLNSISVNSNNKHFIIHGGLLLNHSRTQLVHVPHMINGHVFLPNTTHNIPFNAFLDRQYITEISFLHPNLSSLSQVSFENMPSLARINVGGMAAPYFSNDGILIRRSTPQTILHVPKAITGHITLSNWLSVIPDLAFENRSGITAITFLSTNPPVISGLTFAGINKAAIRLYVAPSMRNTFIARGWGEFDIIDQGVTEIRLTELPYTHPNINTSMSAIARPVGSSFYGQVTWQVTGNANFTTSGNHNELISFIAPTLGMVKIEVHYMGMMTFANVAIIPPHKCNCNLPWCLECTRPIWWRNELEPFIKVKHFEAC